MGEEKKQKKKIITQEDIMKILDTCYDKSLSGLGKVSPPVSQMARTIFPETRILKKHVKRC